MSIVVSDAKAWWRERHAALLENPKLEIIFEAAQSNASRCRNRGVRKANSEWILLLDGDCELPVSVAECLHNFIRTKVFHEEKIFGGVYLCPRDSNLWSRTYHQMQIHWLHQRGISPHVENLLGGFLLIRKKLFQSLGGFRDEISWAGEETEFLRRAQAEGVSLELIKGASVIHHQQLNGFGFFRRAIKQGWAAGFHRLHSPGNSRDYFMKSLSSVWKDVGLCGAGMFVSFLVVGRFVSLMGAVQRASRNKNPRRIPVA